MCIDVLNGGETPLPQCYFRFDIAHFVKNLHRMRVFLTIDKRVKTFFLNCFGLLILAETYEQFKFIVENILIVANSKKDGTNVQGEPLPAETAEKILARMIRTHLLVLEFVRSESSESECESIESNPDQIILPDAVEWIQSFVEKFRKTQKEENGENGKSAKEELNASSCKDNMYFLPAITVEIKKLCLSLPFWSTVMRNKFNSPNCVASSSDVESNFNILKNIVLHDQKKMRPDCFLEKYIKSVNGSTNLSMAHINEYMVTQFCRCMV